MPETPAMLTRDRTSRRMRSVTSAPTAPVTLMSDRYQYHQQSDLDFTDPVDSRVSEATSMLAGLSTAQNLDIKRSNSSSSVEEVEDHVDKRSTKLPPLLTDDEEELGTKIPPSAYSVSKPKKKKSKKKSSSGGKSKSKHHSLEGPRDGKESDEARRLSREERKSRRKMKQDHVLLKSYMETAQQECLAAFPAASTNLDDSGFPVQSGDETGAVKNRSTKTREQQQEGRGRVSQTMTDMYDRPPATCTTNRKSTAKAKNRSSMTDHELLQLMLNSTDNELSDDMGEDNQFSPPVTSIVTRSSRDHASQLARKAADAKTEDQKNPMGQRPVVSKLDMFEDEFEEVDFDSIEFDEPRDDFKMHFMLLSPWSPMGNGDRRDGKYGSSYVGFDPSPSLSSAMPLRGGLSKVVDEEYEINYQAVVRKPPPTMARMPQPVTNDHAQLPELTRSLPNPSSGILIDEEPGGISDGSAQQSQSVTQPESSSGDWIFADVGPMGRRTRRYQRARGPGAVAMVGRAFAQSSGVPARSDVDSTERSDSTTEESSVACALVVCENGENPAHMLEATAVTDEVFIAESIGKGQISNKCKVITILAVLGIVALAVGLTLALTGHGGTAAEPTASPTSMPTASLDDLIEVLTNVSSFDVLSKVGTPQHSAMFWLANYDQMDLNWSRRLQALQEHEIVVDESLLPLVQRYVLLLLYYATQNEDGWHTAGGWLDPTSHECDWGPSITCNDEGLIVILDLSRNNVYGTIPSEIEFLQSLDSIIMNDNLLHGPFPLHFNHFSNLETLELSRNYFTGTIPNEIGKLSLLVALNVSFNRLNGTISQGLCETTLLKRLDLSFNGFSGTVTACLEKANRLEFINFRNNQLSGAFPILLQSMADLSTLQIDYNLMTGQMPKDYDFVGRREKITASNNYLTGMNPYDVPLAQMANLTFNFNQGVYRLQHVSLAVNLLSGTINPMVTMLPSLLTVDMTGNIFSGPVFGFSMTNIEHIGFGRNFFNGTLPSMFSNRLKYIDFGTNNLGGTITDLWKDLVDLEHLDLGGNSLVTGTIPEELGQLGSAIHHLNLGRCDLQGTIPSSFGNLSHLSSLDLSSNKLRGHIPSEFGGLESARYLDVSSNELTGAIPSTLGKCTALTSLTLADNALSGSLPTELSNLNLLEQLLLRGNHLTGSVSDEVCRIVLRANTSEVELDCNMVCLCCPAQTFQGCLS